MLHMMRWRVVKRLLVVSAILALPVTGYAQEAAVSGTVTDATGVLPGVTFTALHEAMAVGPCAAQTVTGTCILQAMAFGLFLSK